ncbi:MAG TPA: response regulator transcription factor [Fluviicola sp.]|nr:response regulator transcription factor [Fluviicola sp.]
MEKCRIALVDDKPYNVQVLAEKLGSRPDYEIVSTTYGGLAFLEALKNMTHAPDVVFMDIDMPDLNGIETVQRAKSTHPEIHFLMITVFDDEERVFQAIQAGASGYLLKDESISGLHKAVDDVLNYGGAPMSPSIARKAFQYIQRMQSAAATAPIADQSPLSSREMDILAGLAEGKSYMIIAEKLFISPHTVRKHMTNIYEKLHVNSKVEAVRMALEKKWV